MIISGQNFRSLAGRDEISFSAEISLSNTSGVAEFGFSGENDSLSFNFSNGRVVDPKGRYFNSYSANGPFALSGNLETGVYDYYVDGELFCSQETKNNFKVNKFFANTTGCSIDLDLSVYGAPQKYSISNPKLGSNSDSSLLVDITNDQEEDFIIFTGALGGEGFAHNWKLDTDVPSGKYDGTYIQDYRYYLGSGDLDECNGISGVTPEYPSGVYHYHVTNDWPYVMSCFRGEPVTQVESITEVVSGTAPKEIPNPWLTDKYFDKQTPRSYRGNIRLYGSGVNVEYSDEYTYITSDGIPHNFYGPFSGNPNQVSVQDHVFKIPINPSERSVLEALPMGPIGVAIDGVPIDLLSDEYYKQRGRWRLAVHPNSGNFGLDKNNAHVQPNGTYHYHAGFTGIAPNHDFNTPNLVVTGTPSRYQCFQNEGYSQYVNVFGVNIFATSGVKQSSIGQVANTVAEIIDNNLDGIPDNLNVANALADNQASMLMSVSGIKPTGMLFNVEGTSGINLSNLTGYHALQLIKEAEINTTGSLGTWEGWTSEYSAIPHSHKFNELDGSGNGWTSWSYGVWDEYHEFGIDARQAMGITNEWMDSYLPKIRHRHEVENWIVKEGKSECWMASTQAAYDPYTGLPTTLPSYHEDSCESIYSGIVYPYQEGLALGGDPEVLYQRGPAGTDPHVHSITERTFEKAFKLVYDYGWSDVYPDSLGLLSGSKISEYMDSGRGAHFEWCEKHRMPDGLIMDGHIHGENQTCVEWAAVRPFNTFWNGKANGSYPSGSWYHYYNPNCDYACQTSKYAYWGVTSLMGAQAGREGSSIWTFEWDLVTPKNVITGDSNLYNLLTDSQYKLPTGHLPTGKYTPSTSASSKLNTGHSPLIGYAFDGYPIYGPIGYTDPLNSGEVKEMKSSYLPRQIEREPNFPKKIKQYNDLYLPYGIDLYNDISGLNTEGNIIAESEWDISLSLYTNFGNLEHAIPMKKPEDDPNDPAAARRAKNFSWGKRWN